MKPSYPQSLTIGLALFSMFFGSGNLIFPLAVGQATTQSLLAGTLGFLLSGVLVPFLGVLAMIAYDGQYLKFFQTLGPRLGFLFAFLLLVFWIPLGSAPRCVTLAFANIYQDLPIELKLWQFSFLYCSCVLILCLNQKKFLELLGKYLTPLFLLTLASLMLSAYRTPADLSLEPQKSLQTTQAFTYGLLEGYNTMDLIASFFFSATIIRKLKELSNSQSSPEQDYRLLTFKSCLVGMSLLAIIYTGLIMVASQHSNLLINIPKDELLPTLAQHLLGAKFSILAKISVVLACLTTSMALLVVFSQFLQEKVLKEAVSLQTSQLITTLITFSFSILGFQGISKISVPVFKVFYPVLIFILAYTMLKKTFLFSSKESSKEAY